MLIPLNRDKFEELVPLAATGAQYRYIWGSFSDCLQRLLVSFAAVIAAVVVGYFLGETLGPPFRLIVGIIAGCYWLWGPIFLASKRNWEYRQYKYSGFWRGQVLDKFVTDELVNTAENVNKRGELVVKENREKRLNLEIGDDSGFTTQVKVPLNRDHQSIRRGDAVEMVVVSSRPDLGRFAKISDVYVADSTVWVSDYPYVQREAFKSVSQTLQRQGWNNRQRGQTRYLNDQYSNDEYGDDRYGNYGDDGYGDRYDDMPYANDPYSDRRYRGDRNQERGPRDRYANDRGGRDIDERDEPRSNPPMRRSSDPYEDEWTERDRYRAPRNDWEQYQQDRRRGQRNRPPRRDR